MADRFIGSENFHFISNYIVCPNLCEKCKFFSIKKGSSSYGDYHCDLSKVYGDRSSATWHERSNPHELKTHDECSVFEDKDEVQIKETVEKQSSVEQTSKSNNSTAWKCFHCGNNGYGYSDKTLFYHERFHPECFEEFKNTELGQKWVEEREKEEAENEKIRNIDTHREKISGIIFPIISCILLFFITHKNNPNGGIIIWGILLIIHFIASKFLISILHPFSARSTKIGIIIKLLFTIIVWAIFIGISYYFSNLLLNSFTSNPKIDMKSSIRGNE
jgi:hypothetical protein